MDTKVATAHRPTDTGFLKSWMSRRTSRYRTRSGGDMCGSFSAEGDGISCFGGTCKPGHNSSGLNSRNLDEIQKHCGDFEAEKHGFSCLGGKPGKSCSEFQRKSLDLFDLPSAITQLRNSFRAKR